MSNRVIALALGVALILLAIPSFADDDKPAPEQKAATEPIEWKTLGACLPEQVEGMKVGELDGQMLNMVNPMNPNEQFYYSLANRTYTFAKDKDKAIDLQVQDTHANQMLLAPFMMAMTYDSPEGSIKTIEVAKLPGKLFLEKDEGKITEINCMVLVGNRLLVMAEADGTVTEEELLSLVGKIDYEKLAKLAK